ncbi:unnamed protein product, partial [Prorocentrum cordatum]
DAKKEKELRSDLSGEQYAATSEKKQFENYLQQIEEMDIRNLSGSSMEAEDPLATPAPLKVHQQPLDYGGKNCEGKYHKTSLNRKYSKEETLE